MISKKRALLIGGTGLVGQHCLAKLIESTEYETIYAPSRIKITVSNPKLQNPVIDFEHIDQTHEMFQVDDLYCCLGTTLAKAGSKEAFKKIDCDLVVQLAHYAHRAGCRRMVYVSSIGASPRAMSFYLKVKAKTEAALKEIGFDSLHILRPSILLGDRTEKRTLERLGIKILTSLDFIYEGPLKKYRPVAAQVVGEYMIACMKKDDRGHFIHQSEVM